ncbi:MAG: FAD-dependent monooxygenase, partial [Pseudomonadota bacterium]
MAFPPLQRQYQLVVSGAGPAGLASVLAALHAGIPIEDILILERRGSGDEGANYPRRQRVVTLDSDSVEFLEDLGVRIPGTPMQEIIWEKPNGRRSFFPYRGAWRTGVSFLFGDRDLQVMTPLAELEKNLLNRIMVIAGEDPIRYGKVLKWAQSENESSRAIYVGRNKVDAETIVIAEGANSVSTAQAGKQRVREADATQFLTLDIPRPRGSDYLPGDVITLFDKNEGYAVYAFYSDNAVSINMVLYETSVNELDRNHQLRRQYEQRLISVANQFGFSVPPGSKTNIYQGQMSMADSPITGNVVRVGDSVRTVDAASGTGTNSALMDAKALLEYFKSRNEK